MARLHALGEFRLVRGERGDAVQEFNARDERRLLGGDQELLTDRALGRIVVFCVVDAEQVDGQQQPARHGDEGQTRRNHRGGSDRICESSAADSHDSLLPRLATGHAQAGHRPSRRTCWRVMTNPLRGMTAIGSVMSVMHWVTPQRVHVKCG